MAGGNGGKGSTGAGGAGGVGDNGQSGAPGILNGNGNGDAGGGGGGGAGGGAGGDGGSSVNFPGAAGGAGGTPGNPGQPGSGSNGGSGGGGGGGNGNGAGAAQITGNLQGGAGGIGGGGGEGGGGGGAGGYGAVVTGSALNAFDIIGGNGGNGGSSPYSGDGGGGGGDGGVGVELAVPGLVFETSGSITGGLGGTAGAGQVAGANGAGGAGVTGAGVSVTNSGSITGGMSGDAVPIQADAIDFTGGANTLDLSIGTLSGNIGVDGAGTTLNFDQSANATLANVITGTGAVIDSGAGTLTLSGANTYSGGTTLSGGTLAVSADDNLGAAAGGVTINNSATLEATASFTSARAVTLGTSGNTDVVEVDAAATLTLTGTVTSSAQGGDHLTKTGTGVLVLSGSASLAGGGDVQAGTLTTAGTVTSVSRISVEQSATVDLDNTAQPGLALNLNGGTVENGSASLIATQSAGGTISDVSGSTEVNLGTGTTLFGGDTYTGLTDIEDGVNAPIARAMGVNAFSAASATSIGENGTLDLNGYDQTIDTIGDGNTGSGTIINSGAIAATLSTGGTDVSSSFDGTIKNGASSTALTKTGTGTLTLRGANTYTGGTALNGGTLELGQQSSGGTGPITFGAGTAETLRIDADDGTLGASVTSFDANDVIDLTALNANGTTASYDGTTLTVTSGATTEAIAINPAPSGEEYVLSADTAHGGGTDVTLAAIPAPVIMAPMNGTDTNSPKPTISGTGESGDTVDLTIALQGGSTTTATALVTDGAWSYTPSSSSPLADGSYSVTAVETSPSGSGTSGTSNTETFTIDTTPPVVSSPTLTVAQNAGETPIGIAAPSDNLTPTGALAIVAGNLPSDGTVTLADGTTPVAAGETLTATQLTGLEFTPTAGAFSQGSTFTYTATDGAGNASTGTAALDIGGAGAPTITGTHATSTNAEGTVTPFTGVTLSDPSPATETLRIALENDGGTLTGAGLVTNADGSFTLVGSATMVTNELDALSFTPTAPAPGTSATTTFVLTDTSSAGTSVADAGTSVTDTAAAAPAPTPTPPPKADTVSIDPNAAFIGHGRFILAGEASSVSGVKSVEISAMVDGVEEDLGAATLNANGTFRFVDHVGPHVQGFITATETDSAGGSVGMTANFSLQAGMGGESYVARQDTYAPDGMSITSTAYEQNDGSRTVAVKAYGETLTSQFDDTFANGGQGGTTFVFSPGYVSDTITEFRPGGPGHDTIALPSSDFTSFADVLRHTQATSAGAVIHDPASGDALLIAGLSKPEVKRYAGDFSFHA